MTNGARAHKLLCYVFSAGLAVPNSTVEFYIYVYFLKPHGCGDHLHCIVLHNCEANSSCFAVQSALISD